MPHRGQSFVPCLPAVLAGGLRRGEGLREVAGALIQKTPQTVSVEVERESSRVKTGRLAHPGHDFLPQPFQIAVTELDVRELFLMALQPVGLSQHRGKDGDLGAILKRVLPQP